MLGPHRLLSLQATQRARPHRPVLPLQRQGVVQLHPLQTYLRHPQVEVVDRPQSLSVIPVLHHLNALILGPHSLDPDPNPQVVRAQCLVLMDQEGRCLLVATEPEDPVGLFLHLKESMDIHLQVDSYLPLDREVTHHQVHMAVLRHLEEYLIPDIPAHILHTLTDIHRPEVPHLMDTPADLHLKGNLVTLNTRRSLNLGPLL